MTFKMVTYSLKAKEIKRSWHLIDATDQILGRLASQVSRILIGKDKPYFSPHLDCGDYVVVTNVAKVRFTGKKRFQKKYSRHSGYPGGFRQITLNEQMAKDPRKVIHHAVSGMLPMNKLHDRMLLRLKIFLGEDHPYESQLKESKEVKNT